METIDPIVVEEWIQGLDDDVEKIGSVPKAGSPWYIVSMKWLNKWRALNHVKTSNMDVDTADDKPMDIDLASEETESVPNAEADPKPDQITDQIGPVDSGDIIEVSEDHEPSVMIKPGLQVSREIEILPPKAWDYFKTRYGFNHEIIRYSINLAKSDIKVEIYTKQVQVLYYNERILETKIVTFHVSLKAKKQELESRVLEAAEKRFGTGERTHLVHLWKFTETHDLSTISSLLNSNKKKIPARLLKDNDEIIDLEIADEDIILAELTPLRVPSQFQEEHILHVIDSLSSSSRRGLTGLQNLGNTCFMNSGIQCLSNTVRLTEYILSDQYRQDINTYNKIGTKGRIVTAYAELIREMWKGSSSSVSPWGLKKALGSFASQFVGFSQQDSQELLSFLIDGIHEDLNQAPKPKPTEIDDKDKREAEIADIWWSKHLERNRSIIVDLMYGQYKSEVRCKMCNNISLAFDPFLMMTLPVPSKETFIKEVTLVRDSQAVQFKVELNTLTKVGDLMKKLPEEMRLTSYIVGESDGMGKDIRRIMGKHEIAEKNRDYVYFGTEDVGEESALVLSNFSVKTYGDNYGCGTSLGITRVFKVEKKTLKDFHYSVFAQILSKSEEKTLSDEEVKEEFRVRFPVFFTDKKEAYYTLSIYNPGRSPCAVCRKETCYGCPVPFTDDPLDKCLSAIRDPALFINIIFRGDRQSVMSKLSPLKYRMSSHFEELQKKSAVSSELTIYDCLRLFSEEEDLDESETIYCRKCKKHQRCSKKMSLYKLPEHLIIHLKRFKRQGYGMQKNGALVNFPLNGLEIGSCNQDRCVYDLYAISNHYGSMGGGHYTAFGKNVNGNWYDFNDSSVSSVRDPGAVVTSAAYVLFYKRR